MQPEWGDNRRYRFTQPVNQKSFEHLLRSAVKSCGARLMTFYDGERNKYFSVSPLIGRFIVEPSTTQIMPVSQTVFPPGEHIGGFMAYVGPREKSVHFKIYGKNATTVNRLVGISPSDPEKNVDETGIILSAISQAYKNRIDANASAYTTEQARERLLMYLRNTEKTFNFQPPIILEDILATLGSFASTNKCTLHYEDEYSGKPITANSDGNVTFNLKRDDFTFYKMSGGFELLLQAQTPPKELGLHQITALMLNSRDVRNLEEHNCFELVVGLETAINEMIALQQA